MMYIISFLMQGIMVYRRQESVYIVLALGKRQNSNTPPQFLSNIKCMIFWKIIQIVNISRRIKE